MSKFDENTFSNRPKKRDIEKKHANIVRDLGISGNVASLTGPEVLVHFAEWREILSNRGMFLVCEKNRKPYEMMRGEIDTLKYNFPDRVEEYYMNIFEAIKKFGQPLAVLDLDFCASPIALIRHRLYDDLSEIAEMGLLKKTGSCMILTASMRQGCYNKGVAFDKTIFRMSVPKIFEDNGYRVDIRNEEPYRGGPNGSNMYTVIYYLKGDYYHE